MLIVLRDHPLSSERALHSRGLRVLQGKSEKQHESDRSHKQKQAAVQETAATPLPNHATVSERLYGPARDAQKRKEP